MKLGAKNPLSRKKENASCVLHVLITHSFYNMPNKDFVAVGFISFTDGSFIRTIIFTVRFLL